MTGEIFNPNPTVFSPIRTTGRKAEYSGQSLWIDDSGESDNEADKAELIDQDEIFGTHPSNFQRDPINVRVLDLIRSIYDPEHPNTLEELRVVSAPQIDVASNHVTVEFTPTVPHCGMSTLIGEYIPSHHP